jgi:hypothetical protein
MALLEADVPTEVIALYLGHESPKTTHLYVEASLAMKRKFRIFATGISMVTYSFATGCPGFSEVLLSGHNSPGVA